MSCPVAALMMRMSRSWTSTRTRVWAWVRPMPMWWSRPLWRRVSFPNWSTRSVRTRLWVSVRVAGSALGRAAYAVAGVAWWVSERWGRRWLYSSTKVSSWYCSSAMVVARGWWLSHFLRVWWKRSILPQVVGGLPPESWRLPLCGLRLDGRDLFVLNGWQQARRTVSAP